MGDREVSERRQCPGNPRRHKALRKGRCQCARRCRPRSCNRTEQRESRKSSNSIRCRGLGAKRSLPNLQRRSSRAMPQTMRAETPTSFRGETLKHKNDRQGAIADMERSFELAPFFLVSMLHRTKNRLLDRDPNGAYGKARGPRFEASLTRSKLARMTNLPSLAFRRVRCVALTLFDNPGGCPCEAMSRVDRGGRILPVPPYSPATASASEIPIRYLHG